MNSITYFYDTEPDKERGKKTIDRLLNPLFLWSVSVSLPLCLCLFNIPVTHFWMAATCFSFSTAANGFFFQRAQPRTEL